VRRLRRDRDDGRTLGEAARCAPARPPRSAASQTAVAVATVREAPPIATRRALRSHSALRERALLPDATRSTAGAHVVAMLERLGIATRLAPRLRMFANGATAMRALAEAADPDALGCTQATEIRYTPGISLVGALPAPIALATVYSAAVAERAATQ
jgi:molybdate transport system substrate-binding protein